MRMMNPKLQAILAKHRVGLFNFYQVDDKTYKLDTDAPISPSCYSELSRELGGLFELVVGEIPPTVQPMLPGMGPVSMVNHPPHYNSGKYEVIEVIEDWKLGYHRGNAVKYIARAGIKDPTKEVEDLEKAVWYLKRYMEILKAAKEGRDATRPNAMNPRTPASISATAACDSDQAVVRTDIAPNVLAQLRELKGHWGGVSVEGLDKEVLAFFPEGPVSVEPDTDTSVWAVLNEN
jgi:hypothetical protein